MKDLAHFLIFVVVWFVGCVALEVFKVMYEPSNPFIMLWGALVYGAGSKAIDMYDARGRLNEKG